MLTVPLWALMKFSGPPEIFLAQLVFALLVGAYSAVNPVAICEIFPPAVRSPPPPPPTTLPWGSQVAPRPSWLPG